LQQRGAEVLLLLHSTVGRRRRRRPAADDPSCILSSVGRISYKKQDRLRVGSKEKVRRRRQKQPPGGGRKRTPSMVATRALTVEALSYTLLYTVPKTRSLFLSFVGSSVFRFCFFPNSRKEGKKEFGGTSKRIRFLSDVPN